MPPDEPASPFVELIPGSVWIASCVEAAGKSPAARFVRRHRKELLAACVAMPGAALLSAKIEALGFVPAGAPGAFWPAVSAAIAGALTASPRLLSGTLALLRVVRSAATAVLALTGAAAIAVVVLWDERDPASAWTLGETVTRLQANAPTILSFLLVISLTFCATRFAVVGGFRSRATSHAALTCESVARSDRELTARHEAAHALVACVLGTPLESAWISNPHTRSRLRIGGAVSIGMPPVAQTLDASYGLLARKIAVNVAGVVGERGPRCMEEIIWELHAQRDWTQATELSWFAASLRPGQVLVERVLDAVIPALHTVPWTAAIEDGAKALLRAGGDPVPPDVFAAIARRFSLALPAVETLAVALLNSPTREIAT